MKFIHKLVLLLVIFFNLSSSLYAYSYAAAGKEPTIDAKEEIIKAINTNDFAKAKEVFKAHEKNYKYLSELFVSKLYSNLWASLENKDKKEIVKNLEISLGAEIQRRIAGGLKNIKTFNVAKVMLAKANKFYKLLSVSLDDKTNRELKKAIKTCMNSIGNPGLFGVGSKPANKENYIKNQKIIINIIQSL
jgi:hypothetical protein